MEQEKPNLADAEIGEEIVYEYKMTPEVVEQYMRASGDRNPWYTGDSPFGGPIAPPVLLPRLHSAMLSLKFTGKGRVHVATEAEFFAPARVGKTVTARGRIVDKYTKRGREYFVLESEDVDEDGVLLCRDRRTYLPRYAPVHAPGHAKKEA